MAHGDEEHSKFDAHTKSTTWEMREVQNSKPLLTIAIPTYNRARYLKELLSLLFDQLMDQPRVELIISDNASPDETPALLEEFRQRGLQFLYIRNEINIGADGNILQCFEEAHGKYVWIVGDDDVVVSGGIALILSHIRADDYDLIHLNSFPLEQIYKPYPGRSKHHVTTIANAKDYAKRVNVLLTFISCNIVNKDTVINTTHAPFAELIETSLVQLGWTYAALNSFKRGLFIHDRLVGARVDNTGGYKLLEVFGPNLKRVTEERLLLKCLRRPVVNGAIQRFWPWMLLQYKHSKHRFLDDGSSLAKLNSTFRDNSRYWIFVYPIAVLPYTLSVFWLLIVRIINRLDKALGYILT